MPQVLYSVFVLTMTEKFGVIPAALFPDSHSAGNTDSINAILSSKLRAYALELREADEHDGQKRREEMMQDVYRTLTIAYRVPPRPDRQVVWQYHNKDGEYREWTGTPKMFYEEHKEVEHFSLVHDPRHEYETLQVFPYMRQMVGGKMPTRVPFPSPSQIRRTPAASLYNADATRRQHAHRPALRARRRSHQSRPPRQFHL